MFLMHAPEVRETTVFSRMPDRFRRTGVVAILVRKCCIRTITIESYRFRRDRRRRREIFRAAKLKHSRCLDGLLISLRELLTTCHDLRMLPKLPFEHLERVDCDVRVTLRDVKVDALELLAHHVLVTTFIFSIFFDCRHRRVRRRHDVEVDFLKVGR